MFYLQWRLLAVVGVMLLAANLILSIEAVERILPQPNPYYDPGVETRLRALRKVLAEEDSVDVLFIGSSVVRTNFQPLAFDQEIGRRAGVRVISFNGGLSDLAPDPVRLYLEKFWLKHASPTWVMQGIRYSELQRGQPAEEYERFQGDTLEARWLSTGPAAKLELLAFENLPLVYYRGLLKDVLKYFPMSPPTGFPIDGRGYNAPSLTLTEARSAGLLEKEPGYTGSYAADTFAQGLATLGRAAEFCEAEGIMYVLVNIPEHGDKYLNQPDGRERYQAYLDQLEALAQSKGIVFVDITDGRAELYRDDALFSDYHHMSPAGAELFTRELAQRLAAYLADGAR